MTRLLMWLAALLIFALGMWIWFEFGQGETPPEEERPAAGESAN